MRSLFTHLRPTGSLVKALSSLMVVLGLNAAGTAQAQEANYPSKPIRLIVGSAPGGAADLPARALAVQLETLLKQPVLVDNRPGAATAIAARAVRGAAPDGYTFFFGNPTVFSEHLLRGGFDATKEMSPVVDVIQGDVFVFGSEASGIDSVDKLVNYAKTKTLRCGYVSPATVMTIAMMATSRPFKYDCIPYKSLDQVIQGLVSNDIQVTVGALTGLSGMVDQKKLFIVGAASKNRSPFSPKTPTLTEQGTPVVVPFRNGLWAPPGISPAIVKVMANAVREASNASAFKERMQTLSNSVDILDSRTQLEETVRGNNFFATGVKLTGYEAQ